MSHEITRRRNGMHEMAYVGEKPWHGLGQELKRGATIEEWEKAAGMDWKVQRSVVRYATDRNGAMKEWPDFHVQMRSDTKAPLGIVSDGFKTVQPRDTLEFFRDLVEVAGFDLITAGTLHGGRKFWAQADIKMEDRIVGKDLVKGRLLMATACDGRMRTLVKEVGERVVCANTLAMAIGEASLGRIEVSHRSEWNDAQVKKIKAELGLVVGSFEKFIAQARGLSKVKMGPALAKGFVTQLLQPSLNNEELSAKQRFQIMEDVLDSKPYKKIMALFDGEGRGSCEPGVKDTAWGLLNAVTEYVDHFAGARNAGNRMDSAWFGRGDELKTRAMKELVTIAA